MLVELTCDQELIFGNDDLHLLTTTSFRKGLRHLASLFKDLVACRGETPQDDPLTFLTRYGVWAPLFWLYLGDRDAQETALPTETDWLRELFYVDDGFNVHNLPKSCNFDHFRAYGTCVFEFDGLKDLLKLDITVRVAAKLCGSGDASLIPSYSAECIGSDCRFLRGLIPCDSNSDCGDLECKHALDYAVEVSNHIRKELGWEESEPLFSEYLANRTFFEAVLEKNDPFYLFMTREANPGDFCTRPGYIRQDVDWVQFSDNVADYTTGELPNNQCYGGSRWESDLHRIIMRLMGSKEAPAVSSKLRFCTPNLNLFGYENMEAWANNMIVTSDLVVSLNQEFFHSVGVVDEPTPTPTGEGAGSLAAEPAFKILFTIALVGLAFVFG